MENKKPRRCESLAFLACVKTYICKLVVNLGQVYDINVFVKKQSLVLPHSGEKDID